MKSSKPYASVIFLALVLAAGHAQAQTQTNADTNGKAVKGSSNGKGNTYFFNLPRLSGIRHFSFGPNSQVNSQGGIGLAAKIKGEGTPGMVPVWTGPANQGDSIITQASGVISIGGALTTNGIITTSGGIRFPDGTTQTTAASGGGGGGGGSGFSLPFLGTINNSVVAFQVDNLGGDALRGRGFGSATGVSGSSSSGIGVSGASSWIGVSGTSVFGIGVSGESTSDDGVSGKSASGIGVFGQSDSGPGVSGLSLWESGVAGATAANGKPAVAGNNTGGRGRNDHFQRQSCCGRPK